MDVVESKESISVKQPDTTKNFLVKPYDIDVAGIVHNSVYQCWLDDLRCDFLEKVQSVEDQVQLGFIPVLARTDISYRRPIKFGDKVRAELRLVSLGKIKWRIECTFYVGDTVVTEAIQEGCVVDLQSHRPISMPKPFLIYWDNKRSGVPPTLKSLEEGIDIFGEYPIVCPV